MVERLVETKVIPNRIRRVMKSKKEIETKLSQIYELICICVIANVKDDSLDRFKNWQNALEWVLSDAKKEKKK